MCVSLSARTSLSALLSLLVLLSLVLVFAAPALAGHGDKRPKKTAILLVAFGTSVPGADEALDAMDERVRKAFPDTPVYWAWTSSIIRHKLAGEDREVMDSPAQALARMMEDGVTSAAVQSLHTIPGEEYHALVKTAHAFQGMPKGMDRVLVGYPLLATHEDCAAAADALLAALPEARRPDEAVVLMGHGTHHPGNAYYPAMQYYFSKRDPNVFVGTVEGAPSLDDVRAGLKERGVGKVWLLPFMAVAGDHAQNDMAGAEPDSWLSELTADGFECEVVLKGTAEYDGVAEIWLDHLRGAMSHLQD